MSQLVLTIYKGFLIAIYRTFYGLISDYMSDHLKSVLLCDATILIHIFNAYPLKSMVIRISDITICHQSGSGT